MADEQTPQAATEATDAEVNETDAPTPETKNRDADDPVDATEAGVPHVGDAAPDDLDTDPASSVVVPNDSDYDLQVPATMQEQKAPKLTGDAEKRGYYGETAADRAKADKAELAADQAVQTNAEAVAAVNTNTED